MTTRWIGVGGLALLTVGCTSEVELEYQSTLFSETQGLVLHDAGTGGHAAMMGTTCSFDVTSGAVLGDIDAPSDQEEVQDVGPDERILVRSPEAAYALTDGIWETAGLADPSIVQVRFTNDGVASLSQGADACTVRWSGSGIAQSVGERCETDLFEVDPDTQRAFVVADGRLLTVHESGIEDFGVAPESMSWNATTRSLFIGSEGAIEAYDEQGDLLWNADVPGTIFSMDDLGVSGRLAVTTRGDMASLTILDGTTGASLSELPTPDVGRVAASRSGEYLGLVLRSETHFFRIEEGGGPKVYTMTPEPSVFDD